MTLNKNHNTLDIITLLEKEMQEDIKKIEVQNDNNIDVEALYQWYLEAEKLIRVLSNVLAVPMTQAINQLRYAGHHAIKSQLQTGDTRQQNLVESYKHCKRAVYDALDFYVYKLSEYYRATLPLISPSSGEQVETLLKNHIKDIYICRMKSDSRIEYYSGIQKTLIQGLNLIEKINTIFREEGISSCTPTKN